MLSRPMPQVPSPLKGWGHIEPCDVSFHWLFNHGRTAFRSTGLSCAIFPDAGTHSDAEALNCLRRPPSSVRQVSHPSEIAVCSLDWYLKRLFIPISVKEVENGGQH
jgi:hypothetical protein